MLVEMTLEHALHVCRRMRESDRSVIMSTRFSFDADEFAVERWRTDGVKIAALAKDGTAVRIGGFVSTGPGVWTGWTVATDRHQEVAHECMWRARRLASELVREAAHRLQACCLASDQGARRYLELMGFSSEGELAQATRDRKDLAMYSMVRSD